MEDITDTEALQRFGELRLIVAGLDGVRIEDQECDPWPGIRPSRWFDVIDSRVLAGDPAARFLRMRCYIIAGAFASIGGHHVRMTIPGWAERVARHVAMRFSDLRGDRCCPYCGGLDRMFHPPAGSLGVPADGSASGSAMRAVLPTSE